MGYKYDENELLAAAVEAVLDNGLAALTFGSLAKRIGIADRSIVYYFPTKTDLIVRTVAALGEELQRVLADAFGDQRLDKDELVRRAWPVLASPESDRLFAVFFELVGLAATSVAPFDTLAFSAVENWIDWLTPRVDAPSRTARDVAYAVVATLDGLLLLRHASSPDAAQRAAAALGVVNRSPRARR